MKALAYAMVVVAGVSLGLVLAGVISPAFLFVTGYAVRALLYYGSEGVL